MSELDRRTFIHAATAASNLETRACPAGHLGEASGLCDSLFSGRE